MKLFITFAFLASALSAQIHLGLKGGAPFTDITEAISNSTARTNLPSHWTLGPMVELDLPASLGVEVDALYRRVGYEEVSPAGSQEFTQGLWDFPILVKYKFRPELLARPYIGGGWTYRHLGDLFRLDSNSNGVVLAAGVRLGLPIIKISPEFRYTRWTDSNTQPAIRTNRNQAEILVGVTF